MKLKNKKTGHKKPLARQLPFLKKNGTATQLIVDGEPFLMLSGELHNSSSSSLDYMEPIWGKLSALKLNTVIAALSWELIEPQEGKFDFSLVDGLVEAAREHDMKLVFLWFGTWKNTWSSYVPSWVKLAPVRFTRACDEKKRSIGTISSLCDDACEADSRAFAAVMRRIRQIDARQQTVLMMQIENETGILGSSRDHSEIAERAFVQPVPGELMDYLSAHRNDLAPEVLEIWKNNGFKMKGDWTAIFGAGADEIFMSWHIGRYVDRVAGAGKAEYDLPMFANAWLVQDAEQKPGQYPSGGPVSKMMDIWRAAAPSIDLLAPDIYMEDFRAVCASYTRNGNPLLIPEARRDESAAANVFYAFAKHDAICFAPFGIDSCPEDHPLAQTYGLLDGMLPLVARYQGTGQMSGFVQQEGETATELVLGGYRLELTYSHPRGKEIVPGCGLVISRERGDYIFAGRNFSVRFSQTAQSRFGVEYLSIEEGYFKKGKWVQLRRLNGDEFSINLPESCGVRRIKVYDSEMEPLQDAKGVALQGIV